MFAIDTGAEQDEIDEMLKGDKVYVAKRREVTIGFFALRKINKRNLVEISGLATAKKQRRKGYGNLLINQAEREARGMNAKGIIVRTSNDNIPALALYQKNGFKITEIKLGVMVEHHGAEIPGWEGIPVRDEVTLAKSLS
jgi:ribosomal protein S18 acetylase RimI-like enzyme